MRENLEYYYQRWHMGNMDDIENWEKGCVWASGKIRKKFTIMEKKEEHEEYMREWEYGENAEYSSYGQRETPFMIGARKNEEGVN